MSDLTPNTGLYWYLITETFDKYRTILKNTLHIMSVFLHVPLTIVLRKDLELLLFTTSILTEALNPYPIHHNTLLMLPFAFSFKSIISHTRFLFLETFLSILALILMPLSHHLWFCRGTLNANFGYIFTLIWVLSQLIFIVDLVRANTIKQTKEANQCLEDINKTVLKDE